MEFGRVPEHELNNIDFSLAPEPEFNRKVLTGKRAEDPKVYLGCAKWGRPEWAGNSLHKSDYTRCDAWAGRIKYWLDHGLEELYFFMHMHDEATSPELTVYLADKLNKICGLKLVRPKFVKDNNKEQGNLFQ